MVVTSDSGYERNTVIASERTWHSSSEVKSVQLLWNGGILTEAFHREKKKKKKCCEAKSNSFAEVKQGSEPVVFNKSLECA